MLAYQTLSMCERLTALPADIGSCIWPSHEREGGDVFLCRLTFFDRWHIFNRGTEDRILSQLSVTSTNFPIKSVQCFHLSVAEIFSHVWFKEHSQGERQHLLFWVPGQNPVLEDDPVGAPAKKSGALRGWSAGEKSAAWFSLISVIVSVFSDCSGGWERRAT